MGKLIAQFMKFGVVGVIAFAIDFGVMVLLHETLGMDPVVAAAISFCVSTVFNYLASMRFVFKHRDDMSRSREFVIFVVLSVVGLIINEICMVVGQFAFIGMGFDYAHGPYYMGVKVFATVVVMFWNFFSRKKWLDASE
ncbi:GtrA family protein [Parafannyhessea umbonata]|uniref:GtrA family protein n=1 Tax=Parafannyhessea umbonata TaxID=604330 RepID=UPI003F978035